VLCSRMWWFYVFFFSSRRRHTRWPRDWSSDVCSSDLVPRLGPGHRVRAAGQKLAAAPQEQQDDEAQGDEPEMLGAHAALLAASEIGRASCRGGGEGRGGARTVEGETRGGRARRRRRAE